MSRRKRNKKPHKTAPETTAVAGACACQKDGWFNKTIAWFKRLPIAAQLFSILTFLKNLYELVIWCKSIVASILSKWPVLVSWWELLQKYLGN